MKLQITLATAAALLSSCAANGSEGAVLTYEMGQANPLSTYKLEPADDMGQAERIAQNLYGTRTLRPPKVAYYCAWRDSSPSGRANRSKRVGRPSVITLTCSFGPEPWSPPPGLVEAAYGHRAREEAVIRAQWDRRGDNYIATKFELEIRQPLKDGFRSQNITPAEVASVNLIEHKLKVPASPDSDFEFNISADVPSRMNTGMKASGPMIPVTIKGTAEPMPRWMLY